METLYALDVALFRVVNDRASDGFLDAFFVFLTSFHQSWWIAALAAIFILARRKWEGLTVLLLCVLAIALADQTASRFFKPLVQRTRPCFELPDVHLLVNQPRSFSFASSHAANAAAVATTLFFFFAKSTALDKLFVWTMSVYAFLVGLSRVYVGVHYPSDVLGGFAIGVASSALVYGAFSYLWKNVIQTRRLRAKDERSE
ncbi:MAG: phosphatase PAP2 family protein [Chloroherpetonaceae bacterium]|nr:phosphatase PAP2 family protein [Chloroherpetonaceae bacterium]MDW8438382.1 phosphatase PAP2 family protein [Chloroherpetonaceae bacterium]